MNFCNSVDMKVSRLGSVLMQIIRYGVVGVLNNLLSYLIYLLVTWLGLDPKVAVSLMYPISAFMAYHGHSRYSFSNHSGVSHKPFRYIGAHAVGYLSNLTILYVFHDLFGFPHQLVQGVAIFVLAGVLYLMFRFFVFPAKHV